MIALGSAPAPVSGRRLPLAALLHSFIDPVVSIASLAALMLLYGEAFSGAWMLLGLLVFALTFPGRMEASRGVYGTFTAVIANWGVVMCLLLLTGWATRTLGLFHAQLVMAWIAVTPMLLAAAHAAFPMLIPRLLSADGVQQVAVIIGAGDAGRKLAAALRASAMHGVRFDGFYDDRDAARLAPDMEGDLAGSCEDLLRHVRNHRVDQIYITLPLSSRPRILQLLDGLRDTTASIYYVPDVFDFDLIQARVDVVGGVPVVAVCESPFYGAAGLIKRASDIVLASLILVLISPLLLLIAVGVKLSSPGPVLFRQRRYGLDGEEIMVYKFRSMSVMEDGDTVTQVRQGDQRVTHFGAFLRRTSLDELPQFINVLQGRMSVVGPRPHAVAHNEMYRKLIKGYMIRHKVRPGITGWAQVNGFRGETETLDKMVGRIEHDLDYLRNWSLGLDLRIVLKTVLVVLRRQNAY